MKKIFTLLASALVASSAMAQGVALDANRIATFYKAYDGTSFEQVAGENGYEKSNNLIKSFGVAKADGTNQNKTKYFPLGLDGVPNSMNDITLTTDYVDAETGFSVPAGHYTTLCNNDLKGSEKTVTLYATGTNTHICNIKKIVVYFAGIPAANSTSGELFADYARINSTRIYTGMDAESVYKNPVSEDEATRNWLGRLYYSGLITSAESVPVYNAETSAISSNTFTQDKLFRAVINFKDAHDPDDATGLDKSNVVSLNNNDCDTEKAIDQSCYDKTTGKATVDERVYNVCHKFVDPDGDGSEGKGGVEGYYGYDWTWSKEMGFAIQIKKSFNVFAIALICGDDDAKTYISNVVDGRNATWTEVGQTPVVPDAIKSVNADNASAAPVKYVANGQVVISKNGNKYTAVGSQIK